MANLFQLMSFKSSGTELHHLLVLYWLIGLESPFLPAPMTDLACKNSLKEGDIMVWIALKEQELEWVSCL